MSRRSTLNPLMLPETSSQPVRRDLDGHFSTEHLKPDLENRTTRGGILTLTAQVLKFCISTGATVIVARLLTPQDYGLISMVVVVTGFLGMFQYLGLPAATIRWPELSHGQVSTLFWVNVGLSSIIALVALLCSPLLVWFYDEPKLTGITAGYALVIFLTGLSIQHLAILQRQMRFVAFATIDISAVAIGLIAAIAAASRGAGYWALVINQIVFSVTTIAGAWMACRWRPSLPKRASGVASILKYGGNLTGYSFTTFLAQNLDNALIGKFWGAYQLGIYSRAYQMLLMPIGQIIMPLATVAVPALSRLADAPERYRNAYLRMLERIAMLTMPGIALMVATSDWIVLLLLGPKWIEAGRIFMLLGMAAIFQPIARSGTWLFITQGRSREMLMWGVIGSSIAVASIVGGLPWGATGVAASYAITDLCIGTPLMFWFIGRKGPVGIRDVYRTIAPAIIAATGSLIVLLLLRQSLISISAYLPARLALALSITTAVSLVVFTILPAGRSAIKSFSLALNFPKRGRESVA